MSTFRESIEDERQRWLRERSLDAHDDDQQTDVEALERHGPAVWEGPEFVVCSNCKARVRVDRDFCFCGEQVR